jgi:hypothetical protein
MTRDRPASRPSPSPERHYDGQSAFFLVACAAVYAAVAHLYWPTLEYAPSSLDDQSQLGEVAGLSFSQLWSRDHFGHFRPLKNLLFWLVSRTDTIATWRTVVLALLASTAACVQRLATKFSQSRWLGLGAVMCWALHPTTASVACWLSATNGLLALLAMLVYLLSSELSRESHRASLERRAYRAAAGAALALGLLSHEVALLSPVLLFCLERLRRHESTDWKLYVGPILVFVVYAAASMLTGGGVSTPYRFESEIPRWLMSFSAPRYFGENALLWFFPGGRFGVLLRDDPNAHLVASSCWWAGILLSGAALWVYRHRDSTVVFGLAWGAISLATFSNFAPLGNTPVAVHYLLVPGVGFAVAITRAFFLLAAQVAPTRAAAQAALISTALAALGGLWFYESSRVVAGWANDEQLYEATLANYPDNVEAMANLAARYLATGRDADAAPLLAEARRLAPADLNVIRNSFALYARANQPQAALALLREHSALLERSEFLIREGEALQQLERFEQARASFDSAFRRADPAIQTSEWCAAGYGLAISQLQTGATVEQVQALVEQLEDGCTSPELTRLRDLLR